MSAPQQPVGRSRPPQPPSGGQLHNQQQMSATQLSITDLAKRIDDFLNNLETALHAPYDLAHAQKDYEGILVALNSVHKHMSDHNMLNVSPDDAVKPGKPDASPEALLKAALERKSTVDAEFDKIVAAAAAAKARGDA